MAEIIDFQHKKLAAEPGDRFTRTDRERVGEYLGSLAMAEMSSDGLDYAEVFAALDQARHFVEQRKLHDMAARLLGSGHASSPFNGGGSAA